MYEVCPRRKFEPALAVVVQFRSSQPPEVVHAQAIIHPFSYIVFCDMVSPFRGSDCEYLGGSSV